MQQLKLIRVGLVAVGVIGATAAVTARSRSSLRADRVNATEQSLVREAAPFNRLVHNRADQLKLELSRLASAHAPGTNSSGPIESENFDGFAWVEPGQAADDFSIKWISQGSGIDASWLESLPLKNLRDGEAIFIRHAGSGGASAGSGGDANSGNATSADASTATEGLLMTAESFAPGAGVVEGQGRRIVLYGVLNQNAFAGLVDDWVGSSRVAQIFDEKGMVLAHTNRRTIGAQLKDDTLVRSMTSGQRSAISGVFDDSEGRPVVAQGERIPQTNLRISLGVPQRLLDQSMAGPVQTVFWLSLLGFSLLAGLAVWVYSRMLTADARAVTERSLLVTAEQLKVGAEMPTALRALEIPVTVRMSDVARVSGGADVYSAHSHGAEASGSKAAAGRVTKTSTSASDIDVNQEPEVPLTFADIETRAQANFKEIIERSAAIRARLNLDFVEDFTGDAPVSAAVASTNGNEPSVTERNQSSAPALHQSSAPAITPAAADNQTAVTEFETLESPRAGVVRRPKMKKQKPSEPSL